MGTMLNLLVTVGHTPPQREWPMSGPDGNRVFNLLKDPHEFRCLVLIFRSPFIA